MNTSLVALGPAGSFTSLTAAGLTRLLDAELHHAPSVTDSLASVSSGAATWAIVPVETNLRGTVHQHRRTIAESGLPAQLEVVDRAVFVVAAKGGSESVRTVASHPHAIEECASWLAQNLPGIARFGTPSTAEAARVASGDETVAAICSAVAAAEHGLTVLAADVADTPGDLTRFLVLGTKPIAVPDSSRRKTELLIVPAVARPVALGELFALVAAAGFEVSRADVLPARRTLGEHALAVDLIHTQKEDLHLVMRTLCAGVADVRLLDTFPAIAQEVASWET